MAPSRRKGGRAAAAAAAAARQQWKIGDLVLAKMKGFPAWPAEVTEPEKWGYTTSDRKKVLVYFYGTKQIAFCNYAEIEAFTEEKKKSLLVKRQGKGADFVRAVDEIINIYEKKQSLTEVISGDEDSKPNNGDFVGSRSKSTTNNTEILSHENNNLQPDTLCVSVGNHDVVNQQEIPKTSLEGYPHDRSILKNEPTEKVSILDQLRQTPLSTTTSTRKRQRDGSLQSSVIQRVPSLRRSRSSSSGDVHKFQKSSMKGNESDQVGDDLVSNPLQEEYSLKKVLSGDADNVSLCCNGGLPSNNCSDDIGSDRSTARSDAEEASMLESNCKLVKCGNGHWDKNLMSNGVTLNGKLDLPVKAGILKKKRKPNRKRATNTPERGTLDKEAEMRAELHESLPESPKYQKGIAGNFSKADGDEHLPLVKRARVRMGKPLMEEKTLDEFVEKGENLELVESLEELDTCIKTSSSVSSPADRTLITVREEANSLLVNDSAVIAGKDQMLWKVNKFQIGGITFDGEAALPPSKRLHRALEAMSANAAKEVDDTPEAPSDIKIISSGSINFPKASALDHPVDGNVGNPMSSHHVQSSASAAFHDNKLKSALSLVSQDPEEPILSLPKVDPDNILSPSLRSPQKKETDVLPGSNGNGAYTSNMLDLNVREEVLQPCDLKLVEKLKTMSSESIVDQLSSPSGIEVKNENGNEALPPIRESSDTQSEDLRGSGSLKLETIERNPDAVMDSNIDSNSHGNWVAAIPTVNVASAASDTSGPTKSASSLSDETVQDRDMSDVAREDKHKVTPKDWGSSDWTPIKDLIAAAQAKRLLSRSTSFPDSVVDGKVLADPVVSPSVTNKGQSVSPQTSVIHHRPATVDRTHNVQNGSRSPFVGQRERGSDKVAASVEATVARRSFEALLCTLSRTKDSIGRATRAAIDCAKYGIAGEVVEILVQHLERESSLYKRVDLFFLVDSITQYSRSQKGGVGDVYLSLVQSVLPRLLSAAAPHGHTAWENRRQCLKVLRLWLERKTLPESIVRHHIRELESVNEISLASSYSRRPSRTERSLNDPIREMEGMFVDEYGSNTSFQLQHFIHPPLLEDDEGSGDDEKSFEAVTPEQNAEVEDDKVVIQTPSGKHRHILEDVDGELEMEDVAPPCGGEASSSCHVSGPGTVPDAHYQHEQHHTLPCAPPLPEDLPPSPPPLPSSPPPMAPSCSTPISLVPQQQSGGSHANSNANGFHLSNNHNNQNHQQHSISQQQNSFQGKLISSESAPYYTQGYGGFPKQMPPAVCPHGSSVPYTSHTAMHSGNNFQPSISTPLPNKAYTLQPPPPPVSNQFSYVQAESQQRPQPWGNSSSFGDRFQYAHGPQGGSFYGDRSISGPPQHENVERGRFPPATNSGSVISDRAETLSSPHSRYGPNSESSSHPSHSWSIPRSISSYPVSSSRSSVENGFSRVNEALSYWRPR